MNPPITIGMITSPQDMMIILVVALIVFGPKKLPEIGKQIGSALRELNRMRGDVQRAFDLDEYTRFDSTPAVQPYHTEPYVSNYPAHVDYSVPIGGYEAASSVDSYHQIEAGGSDMLSDPLGAALGAHEGGFGEHTGFGNSATPALVPPPGPRVAFNHTADSETGA